MSLSYNYEFLQILKNFPKFGNFFTNYKTGDQIFSACVQLVTVAVKIYGNGNCTYLPRLC